MSKIINKYFEVEEGSAYDRLGNKVIQLELVGLTDEGKQQTELTIPAEIESIESEIFQDCKKLEKVTFESGSKLKTIQWGAFQGCSSLTSITIPMHVTWLGASVFEDCYNLEKVIFESPSSLEEISDYAFSGCASLKEIILPNCVETIGAYAFAGCESLNLNFTYPSDGLYLKEIGASAFENCFNLSTQVIEKMMKRANEIGANAFAGCLY